MLGHAHFIVLSLLATLIAGCSIVSPSNSDDGIEFGDAYEIRTTDPSTGEPALPTISDHELRAFVSYGGGCEDHDFELMTSVASDTARIWMRHDANGDACEAYLTEEVRFGLSQRVVRAPFILLLGPGEFQFEL